MCFTRNLILIKTAVLYFRALTEQLKTRDEKILELQKEVYEMKIEKVESLKKDLQEKLSCLT